MEKLHEEPALPVVSHLVQACNRVALVHGSHIPATRGKFRVQKINAKLCEKSLPCVVNHKLWRGQLCKPFLHTPVHSGHSAQVVVALEVDGLAVLPGNSTQTSPAPEFVHSTFGQPFC